MFLLSVPLLGVMTLRLNALAKGMRPRFRTELATALTRWPMGLFATAFAFGYPLLLVWLRPALINSLAELRRWYSWPYPCSGRWRCSWSRCPRSGVTASRPFAAVAQSLRISIRRSWRMFGAILATVCMVSVFLMLSTVIVWMMSPLFGRADLFLIATVQSTLFLVVGAFGVPFVLAVLIVSYQDLKLREQERRGVRA